MFACRTPDARIVGVLHDVVEDTRDNLERRVTLDDLRAEGFSEAIVGAVDGVTNRDGEDYFAFVRRAMRDPIAREVKRADLMDNSDTSRRGGTITDKDHIRLTKYADALKILDGTE